VRVAHGIAAGAAGLGAAVLVACGVQTSDSGTPTVELPTQTGGTAQVRPATAPLPPAPENTVRVDGLRAGISEAATRGFVARSSVEVALIRAAEDQAFADLCAGRVDVVEVARVPTEAEAAACRERGVEVSDPLQVAADAIVVATKNEADVGGDCVTVDQARDMFRAGSPYTTWSQLGFFDLPLTATGRQDGSPSFELFGQVVLGLPDASLADVRADYVAERTDRLEREEVAGAQRVLAARRRIDRYVDRLRDQTADRRERALDAAVARADRQVIARIERENSARERRGDVLTPLEAAEVVRRNAERVTRAKAAAAARVDARFDRELRDRGRRFGRGVLAEARAPGVVGAFRFGYYELFEDQLRPLEIDPGGPVTADGQPVKPTEETADGEAIFPGPSCVFPSPATITTGSYPLARRIYLFTSAQALERDEVVAYVEAFLQGAPALAGRERLVPISDAQLADGLAIARNGGRTPPPQAAPPPTTATAPAAPESSGIPGVSARNP
jgi:ABC-type phosphate transport system substrate-binding protein